MKLKFILFIISILFFSCSKPTELQESFTCKVTKLANTKKTIDFKNQFALSVPKHWKRSLYYDTVQTQIQVADTVKQLTETYILIASLNSGELKIDSSFKNKVLADLEKEQFENAKFKFIQFKNRPSIWFLAKGEKLGKTYHFLQLFIENTPTDYYEITAQFYGNDLVKKRICESITVMEGMEFLN